MSLSDTELEDLANIATRLKAEAELAAMQIVELQRENAQLAYEVKESKGYRLMMMLVPMVVALAVGLAIGWRLGSDGQWDAGWRAARSEADECPK